MSFDFETLYSSTDTAEFNSGKRRFYDNKVTDLACLKLADESYEIVGKLRGKTNEYDPKISYDKNGNLAGFTCNCDTQQTNKNLACRHLIALGLTYSDRFASSAEFKPQVSVKNTDAVALTLSSEYSKRRYVRKIRDDEQKITLTPTLKIVERDRVALKFAVGTKRSYKIKDISDFVSACLSSSYRRYGAELSFIHDVSNFDDLSKDVLRFLIASYREKVQLYADTQNANAYKDELKLIGGDLDDILKIYSGKLIKFEDEQVKDSLKLVYADIDKLDAFLQIVKQDNGFEITCNIDNFNAVYGKNYCYLVTATRIYTLTFEYSDIVLPFLKAITLHKKIFVTKDDMPLFYNSVLSIMSKHMDVKAGDIQLSAYEAPPFYSKVFIDVLEDNSIKVNVECFYDDNQINIFDDSVITDIVRDWEIEEAFKQVLAKYFDDFSDFALFSDIQIYRFFLEGISEIYNYADIFLSNSAKKIKIKSPPKIKVGVKIASDLLEIDFSSLEYSQEDLIAIIKAYNTSAEYIRLSDGSFVNLDDPAIKLASEIFGVDGKNKDITSTNFTLPKYYASFIDAELKTGFFNTDRDDAFKELINNLNNASDSNLKVPSSLKDIMRNYQKTGFRWLKTLSDNGFGGILADDMGLGKSLQVISLLTAEKDKKSIIVAPTTLILNWVKEIEKFAPDLKVLAVYGSQDERRAKVLDFVDYDLIVTSYDLIRRDEDIYKDINFDYAILDEAQYIKNPNTKNAVTVKKLKAKHRFALTGTPIENSLSELWSIFDYIMPGYLLSYSNFRDKFEYSIALGDEETADKLAKYVSPFILRRLKSEVLTELPPKIETVVSASLENEQKDLYISQLAQIKQTLVPENDKINKVVVLSMLTKLRQICCSPELIEPNYGGNSAKNEMCLELIDSAVESGKKILLFSQFTSMLDIIERQLVERGISYYMLTGSTPKPERLKLVDKFNSGDVQVFLISLKAGGTGLNLTSADVVIHYDPWWNESVMNQATDRAHRMGQTNTVQVYKLIVNGTIEEKILKLQEKKSALSNMIIGAKQSGQLSYEDILEILG